MEGSVYSTGCKRFQDALRTSGIVVGRLHWLVVFACLLLTTAPSVSAVPRRTFARKALCDSKQCSLEFTQPEPDGIILNEGQGNISVAAKISDDIEFESWSIVLYFPDQRLPIRNFLSSSDGTLQAVFSNNLVAGTHTLHATLLDQEGQETGAVVYARFLVRSKNFDEMFAARDLCSGSEGSGELFPWFSPCGPLIQMGHEKRLNGAFHEARECFVNVIFFSAMSTRKGSQAHAQQVLPYLELAKLEHQVGNQSASARALQLLHRLQPGYYLSSSMPQTPIGVTDPVISLNLNFVPSVNLARFSHLVCEWTALEILQEAGMSRGSAVGRPGGHYKILSFVASHLRDALIVELGTMHGASSVALAAGHTTNRVVTYNVVDDFSPNVRACGMSADSYMRELQNAGLQIEFRFEDIMQSPSRLQELTEADLIHIDINHHGDIEDALIQYLLGQNYQGILMLDDIHLNSDMDRVWGSIGPPLCKYDLTDFGHSVAGTGLVDFACKISFV